MLDPAVKQALQESWPDSPQWVSALDKLVRWMEDLAAGREDLNRAALDRRVGLLFDAVNLDNVESAMLSDDFDPADIERVFKKKG